MNHRINQNVFSGLMVKLSVKPGKTNKERFNKWMRKTVKSEHYADNEAMCNAYERIIEY